MPFSGLEYGTPSAGCLDVREALAAQGDGVVADLFRLSIISRNAAQILSDSEKRLIQTLEDRLGSLYGRMLKGEKVDSRFAQLATACFVDRFLTKIKPYE